MSNTNDSITNNQATNSNNNNDSASNTNGNQIICIKRSETTLASVFEDMYLNERLVDVTLTCNNGQLQAHKLVLAACSPYFSGLFDRLANPFHYPVIIIKDMDIDDLRLIVEFMYKGQLTLIQDKLTSLVRSAENLQIIGLSNLNPNNITPMSDTDGSTAVVTVESPKVPHYPSGRSKRARRSVSSLLNHNQIIFERTYHHARLHNHNDTSPDKLLEQSMITGDSLESGNQQLAYATSSSKNSNQQMQHMPTTSVHLQHSMSIDPQLQQSHHNQISNQLQVLSHSLASNRASVMSQTGSSNSQSNSSTDNIQTPNQQPHRGRVHPCNICWKTFRERANLKRHLQVHSLDRVMYACLDCNKTFSWKDNYIRHTKTAHHLNNARQQSS